jgi:hypothetical protein
MKAIGGRPAAEITTLEINELLNSIAGTGISAKTVTRSRPILSAIFYYGMKDGTGLTSPRTRSRMRIVGRSRQLRKKLDPVDGSRGEARERITGMTHLFCVAQSPTNVLTAVQRKDNQIRVLPGRPNCDFDPPLPTVTDEANALIRPVREFQ